MEQRGLGGSGVEVSRLILGCGGFGGIGSAPELFGAGETEEEAQALMDAAWDAGINAFDTADAYGGGRSERAVGAWISRTQRFPVVTTKVFHSVEGDPGDRGLAPERIRTQVAGSLRRLGLAHVDLYMIHEPDPATPLEQTLEAFSELVSHAVVGAVGACNVDRAYVESALEISARRGLVRLEWIQNEYNLLARDDALLSLCAAEGLGFTPFSPLCGGWLAGRYSRGLQPPPGSRMTLRPGPYEHLRTPHTFDALQAFERMATERGLTMATLALGWLLSEPRITAVVIGPRRPEHLRAPIDALGVSLDGPQREEIAAIFGGVAA